MWYLISFPDLSPTPWAHCRACGFPAIPTVWRTGIIIYHSQTICHAIRSRPVPQDFSMVALAATPRVPDFQNDQLRNTEILSSSNPQIII